MRGFGMTAVGVQVGCLVQLEMMTLKNNHDGQNRSKRKRIHEAKPSVYRICGGVQTDSHSNFMELGIGQKDKKQRHNAEERCGLGYLVLAHSI
jgi:hypothetical protein